MKTSVKLVSAISLVHCTLVPSVAWGQTAALASAPQDQQPQASYKQSDFDGVIDEVIVVTARKREETAQNVPISMGVVSDKTLANTGASSLLQIQAVAPGVNLAKAPTGSEIGITLRGLGSSPGSPSFDSSVSLFVDGVYAPRSREFASSMFDVQRIEVIKGTQAALLGKNTSLGAINLITRKPGDEFAANFRGSSDFELNSTLLTGGVDVPVTDTLAVRVSGQALNDKGWVENEISGKKNPRNKDNAVRFVGVWEPTDNLEVVLLGQHDVTRLKGTPIEFVTGSPAQNALTALAGLAPPLETLFDRRNATSLDGLGTEQTEKLSVDRMSGTINLGIVGGTLTSVTGYSKYIDGSRSDTDFGPGAYGVRSVDEKSRQISQEVRFVSAPGHPLEFVLGGLYLHNELDNSTIQLFNYPIQPLPGVPLAGTSRTTFVQKTDTFSVFLQPTYNISDTLHAIGGIRYTNEEKNVDLARDIVVPGFASVILNPPYAPFALSRRDSPVDYSFGLQSDFTRNVHGYVSYGKGTKSGGFASSATFLDRSAYSTETAKTFEIGIKTQDPGRSWLLNLSAFDTKVDDFQVVTFNGASFDIFNTDLQSRGFELEAYWYPVKALRLNINNTYADAKDRNTGAVIPLAPKWNVSSGFAFRHSIAGSVDVMIDGSIDYRSSRTYQQNPAAATVGGSFAAYNLSVAIAPSDDRWELRLIGRNLTNANDVAFAFPTPIVGTQSVISERPRTIALQFSVRM